MFQSRPQSTACPIYCTVNVTTHTIYSVNVNSQSREKAEILQQLPSSNYLYFSQCCVYNISKKQIFFKIRLFFSGCNMIYHSTVHEAKMWWLWLIDHGALVCQRPVGGGVHLHAKIFAWASGSLQLAESHVQLWTAPSTREGRPGGWADRCRAGQRLLCSHQHESRQRHRTPLSHPSAAVHCHPFPSMKCFLSQSPFFTAFHKLYSWK